jgi:hypothetical protein
MQQPSGSLETTDAAGLAGKDRPVTSRGGGWMAGRDDAKCVYLDDHSYQ